MERLKTAVIDTLVILASVLALLAGAVAGGLLYRFLLGVLS